MATLSGQGAIIVGPCEGRLASGHTGFGRLADADGNTGGDSLGVGKTRGSRREEIGCQCRWHKGAD